MAQVTTDKCACFLCCALFHPYLDKFTKKFIWDLNSRFSGKWNSVAMQSSALKVVFFSDWEICQPAHLRDTLVDVCKNVCSPGLTRGLAIRPRVTVTMVHQIHGCGVVDFKASWPSTRSGNENIGVWHYWEVEVLMSCLHPGPLSGSSAFPDSSEATNSERLESILGLHLFDNILCLGVGHQKLEPNQTFVLTSISGSDGQEKVATLRFIHSFMPVDFWLEYFLQGIRPVFIKDAVASVNTVLSLAMKLGMNDLRSAVGQCHHG